MSAAVRMFCNLCPLSVRKNAAIRWRAQLSLPCPTIQPPGIIGPGHLIDTDSKGNICIGGAGQGMQRLLFKGLGPTPAH
jgi:hypothetical protein